MYSRPTDRQKETNNTMANENTQPHDPKALMERSSAEVGAAIARAYPGIPPEQVVEFMRVVHGSMENIFMAASVAASLPSTVTPEIQMRLRWTSIAALCQMYNRDVHILDVEVANMIVAIGRLCHHLAQQNKQLPVPSTPPNP